MVESYLNAKDIEPMTEENTRLFAEACLAEMQHDMDFSEDHSKELGFSGQVLYKRLNWLRPIPISIGLAVVVIMLSQGIPGKLVMWAFTLNRLYDKKGSRLTLRDLAEAFPLGFPTDTEELRLWDAQKCSEHGVNGDNMVDIPSTWESPEDVKVPYVETEYFNP